MPAYEHVFLARQDVSAQQVEALTETFKTIITEGGGTVDKTEYWGLKSLAYKIKKNRKAHYSLMNITAPHAAVAEMERQMNLNEDVIRHLTLKMGELEEGPSIMMRSKGGRDRDDRRGRRDDRRDGRPPRSAAPAGDGDGDAKADVKTEAKAETKSDAPGTDKPETTEAEA